MAQCKACPRRLTVEARDCVGAERVNASQCVVAKAARRQWKRKVSVTNQHVRVYYRNPAHSTLPKYHTVCYVTTDPLFADIITKFDQGILDLATDLPITFVMERK